MSDQVMQIARRIRALREISDYSVGQMAEACGVSCAEYEAYESGSIDIPISFLLKLAERFHVDMTEMLTGEAPRLRVYSLTRAGKGVEVERRQHYIYKNLAHNFIHRKVEPLYVTVLPGANPDLIPSAHDGHEFDYVLEGTLRIRIDDRELYLYPGDSVYFDSSHPHALQAAEGNAVRMLAIVIP